MELVNAHEELLVVRLRGTLKVKLDNGMNDDSSCNASHLTGHSWSYHFLIGTCQKHVSYHIGVRVLGTLSFTNASFDPPP